MYPEILIPLDKCMKNIKLLKINYNHKIIIIHYKDNNNNNNNKIKIIFKLKIM